MILTNEMIEQIKTKAEKIEDKGRLVIAFYPFNGYYEIWIEEGSRFPTKKIKKKLDKN